MPVRRCRSPLLPGMLLVALLAAPLAGAVQAEASDGPARLVVRFDGPPGLAEGNAFLGARVEAVDHALAFAAVEAPQARRFVAEAQRHARVLTVEHDVPAQAHLTPDDARWASQYGPALVDAPRAWDATPGNAEARVCILDTGVRGSHEDLAGARWKGGKDFVNADDDPADDNGHGTHVAGIAAASMGNGRGIAGMAQAALHAGKVLDAGGSGWLSVVAQGVRWCADLGPRVVISMSLGGSSPSTPLQDALKYAQGKGAVIVAAAGNEGCTGCISYPAAYPEAMAITCVDSAKARCSFSNQGSQAFLTAPGLGVLSTYHRTDADYASLSGTSMSTPHVAGVAALVWSAAPALQAGDLRTYLRCTAEDLGSAGWDAGHGWGLVDAERAVRAAKAQDCGVPAEPPPPPALPDLRPEPIALPAGAAEGDKLAFTTRVVNEGPGGAGTFRVKWYVDGASIGERAILGLAPGASTEATSPPWTATAGPHRVRVHVDAWRTIAEQDEADNEWEGDLAVAARPDLAIVALQAPPGAPGSSAPVTVQVRNLGSAAAPTFRVKLYVDGPGVVERAVLGLEPGASAQVELPWTPSGSSHTLRVLADAWRVVAEADEANNDRSAPWSSAGGASG